MASEGLDLWGSLWVQTLEAVLVPLLDELSRLASIRSREHAGIDKTLIMVVHMVGKTINKHLLLLVAENDFPDMWVRVLAALKVRQSLHRLPKTPVAKSF